MLKNSCKKCTFARMKIKVVKGVFILGSKELEDKDIWCSQKIWQDQFGIPSTRQYARMMSNQFKYNQRACDFFDGEE